MANFGFNVPYVATIPRFSFGLNPFSILPQRQQQPRKQNTNTMTYQKWQDMYGGNKEDTSKKATTLGKDIVKRGDKGDTSGIGSSPAGGWGTPSSSKSNSYSSTHTDKAVNDMAISGLSDIGRDMAMSAAAVTGLGMYAGVPASQLANAAVQSAMSAVPGALSGLVGQLGATSIGAQPSTSMGKLGSAVIGGVLGSLAGPFGGILGGLLGPSIAGLAEDAMDTRSMESIRDAMEDTVGTFSGRRMGQAFSDAYDQTKSVAPSFGYAVDSMSMSPTQKNVAKTSFSSALGTSFSSKSKDKLGDVARNIGATPAVAYAGAMSQLGSFGAETDPTGGLHGAVDSISGTVGAINDAYSGAMSSFGGHAQAAQQATAPSDDRASMAMANAMSDAAQQAAAPGSFNSPSADPSSSPSASPSGGFGGQQTGGSPAGNTNGGGSSGGGGWGGGIGGGFGSDQGGYGTGVGGSIGGGAMSHGPSQGNFGGIGGFGNIGGGWGGGGIGSGNGGDGDNNGGPNGGSDSQGTGEGQAGDGTGSGANGQNDGGDDGGW